MLLLKSDDDENETNADVLKRPRMCVCVLFLSLALRVVCTTERRAKVRKEKGSAYENPLNIKVCLEQTQTFTHDFFVAGVSLLSSLSLFVEKCQIKTTKASQGGE